MLDKVIISSCKKQAMFIFDDRVPFTVSSDDNVVPLLMWFLGHPNAKLTIAHDGETVTGIEFRRDCSGEVTMKIDITKVAA
jgi:hypothetical protein